MLEEGLMGEAAEDSSPEGLLAQAIEEHGPGDAGKLVEWLREYGYELTPTGEDALGDDAEAETELFEEEEAPADDMLGALDEAEAVEEGDDIDDADDNMEDGMEEEGGEFNPGGSLADARRSAASRAFKQHYGAK